MNEQIKSPRGGLAGKLNQAYQNTNTINTAWKMSAILAVQLPQEYMKSHAHITVDREAGRCGTAAWYNRNECWFAQTAACQARSLL